MVRLLIGTYPEGGIVGSGEGIWTAHLDLASGVLSGVRLLVEVDSPSFLAQHPAGPIFAVTEDAEGRLTELTLTQDALTVRATRSTDGVHPCHVVATDGFVWLANYSSGTFVSYPVDQGGDFTGPHTAFAHSGSGPNVERQEGPHAHFCLELPDRRTVWLLDLGTDQARRFRRAPDAPAGIVDDGIAVTFPPGTGPRHGVGHPSGAVFVVGELDSQIHTVRTDPAGGGLVIAAQPACATAAPKVGSFPSHIALSADGKRLYVAVRGPDILATFAVSVDAHLTHLADTPIGGVWPRHFAVVDAPDGDLVVVANQHSSAVVVLRIDPETGLGALVFELGLPRPACILPV